MVRRRQTIENALKAINHTLFRMQEKSNHSFLYRIRHRFKIEYHKGESYALAWALNKVEPYGKKKTYHPGPKETYCRSAR